MNSSAMTAARASLLSCHACHQLSQARRLPAGSHAVCSRCEARLHLRKPDSISRTWALVLAALILYIPGCDAGYTFESLIASLGPGHLFVLAALILYIPGCDVRDVGSQFALRHVIVDRDGLGH